MSFSFTKKRPTSLLHCLGSNGLLDPLALMRLRRVREEEAEASKNFRATIAELLSAEEESNNSRNHPPKKRAKKCVLEHFDKDGNRKPCPPHESPWFKTYLACGKATELSEKGKKKFRLRFRLPFDQFWELVDEVKQHHLHFGRHLKGSSHPVELLLLGTLRYLGRGFTFDDLEESTAISREVHRKFFHSFITFGKTILYEKHVREPTALEFLRSHCAEFSAAGCHGAVGSMDGVHILCERVPHTLRNLHKAHKMTHTARAFNVTVNHRRMILSCTSGNPATFNDQTLVMFDHFVRGIHEGRKLSDLSFKLWERDGGAFVHRSYKGAWVICDNGYKNWSVTVPPVKVCTDVPTIRWSEWIESMRKDVECTFGILKGRFRVLKSGIRVHGTDTCDAVFLTCCALHNWLLDVDGLNEPSSCGISQSDYLEALGNFDADDHFARDSFASHRLHNPSLARSLPSNHAEMDFSGMGSHESGGWDDDWVGDARELPSRCTDSSGNRIVRLLPPQFFRERLVEHFDILFERRAIIWPKRNPKTRSAQRVMEAMRGRLPPSQTN